MRYALWGLALTGLLLATSSPAEQPGHVCATSLFQADKLALSERFERPGYGDLLRAPRPSPAVGDTMTFWAWDLTVMPPPWIQVPATCRAVGEYCYVFVADDQWNVNMDATDVAEVVLRFDQATLADPTRGIYETDTEAFGPPPDTIDNDPKIYIFYMGLGCFMGSCFDGYFSVFNEYTEAQAQAQGGHSNEVEMFYMSCDPIDPTANSTLSVLAHEFEHMIHWNMDPDEESWVDEGCAEYAMHLYGWPDPISGFPTNPDNNLINWGNQWADYIQTYLFTMYFAEKYGGDATITALVAEPANSIAGVENTLALQGYSESFEDVFVDWTVANFLDDVTIGDGRYGYAWIALPPFTAFNHNTYPVSRSTTVNHWAADYIRFTDGSPMRLTYDGADDSVFGVMLLKMDDVAPTVVEPGILDAFQYGDFLLGGFGADYDTLVMVSSNISSAGATSYAYATGPATGVIPGIGTASGSGRVVLYQNRPNPFRPATEFRFLLPAAGFADLAVYDVAGRLVRSFGRTLYGPGEHVIGWNGTDALGKPVESGVYFYRLQTDTAEICRKATLLR
jgi:hypothetical protein